MEKIFSFFRFTNQNVFGNDTLQLIVINSNGLLTKLQTFGNATAAEVIASAMFEFSEISDTDYRGHQIVHVRNGTIINYNTSMNEAGVVENDELLLSRKHKPSTQNIEFTRVPDMDTINKLTGFADSCAEKTFNLKRSFVRMAVGDYSYIRNFLVEMAVESAYILSAGPHADLLIDYFKQKIVGRRKYQDDAVKSLTELGFERSRCIYAIKLKKNIYSEALNWLIDHSEDSSSYRPYNSSMSFIKTISKNSQEKFLSLSQIIRIYGRAGQQHCEKMLKIFAEMGFDSDESMVALSASDWDATRAVALMCDKDDVPASASDVAGSGSHHKNGLAERVLESAAVQNYLSDPEVFMTIIFLLGSGAGSSGIEHNWESSKIKYERVASVLKRYNDEKQYNVLDNLKFN